ncbi:protein phosphatase 2C domain-containing protein [Botrimarina sp.]|uniref:PP2C family protein-serine/threonine phosphatase n=1 Tax=Botrimarina sp. TaxID=2795802 RepID=UPI0032ED6A48
MPENPPETPAFAVHAVGLSDVGMRRAANQDAVAIWSRAGAGPGEPIAGDALLLVADGMGAHAAGELASQMAAETIPHCYAKSAAEAAPAALRQAIREANRRIHAKGQSSPDLVGMGTTCSCLVVTHGAALLGHVGDSRVYRLRGPVLEQLTFDHSLVWEMAATTNVSHDKVPSFIPKNVITRSLGPHDTESLIVDLEGPHPLEDGDTFLVCSDGLTGVVDDALAAGVLAALPPREAAQTLIDLANLRGGPDNISVIVARAECLAGKQCVPQPCRRRSTESTVLTGCVAAGCAVAGVLFWLWGNLTGMLLAAFGLGAAVALYWLPGGKGKRSNGARLVGGPYGNGPYRRTECGDFSDASATMGKMVKELASLDARAKDPPEAAPSDAPAAGAAGANGCPADDGATPTFQGGLSIDWSPHRETQAAADAAHDAGDCRRSIALYAEIIRSVINSACDDSTTHRYKAKAPTAR